MTTNVGTLDRVVRIALAVIFSTLYVTGTVSGAAGIVVLLLGGGLLVTALVGTCGIYALFGISTCSVKR